MPEASYFKRKQDVTQLMIEDLSVKNLIYCARIIHLCCTVAGIQL